MRLSLTIFLGMCIFLSGCGNSEFKKADSISDSITVDTITALSTDNFTQNNGRIRVRHIGSYREVFNDSNKYQYAYAEKLGINPITDLRSTYCTKRPIVKITPNQYYHVDSLTHSIPYLVPEAANLLKDIGKNFIDTLANRGGKGYKIKVTSLLRTPSTIRRLRRVNINATDSSTHQFGTTFDISWSNFYCTDSTRIIRSDILKGLLAEVLYDLRNQQRCLVKYEHKTACFHVTTTK